MAQGAEHETIESKKGKSEKTAYAKSPHGIGDGFHHIQYDGDNKAISQVRGVIAFAHKPQGRDHKSTHHGHSKGSTKS